MSKIKSKKKKNKIIKDNEGTKSLKMEKVLKRIVAYIAIIVLYFIFLDNLIIKATLANNLGESVTLEFYGVVWTIITFLDAFIIFAIWNGERKKDKNYISKCKYFFIVSLLIIYTLLQILLVEYKNQYPSWDQKYVYDGAVLIYEGKTNEIDNVDSYFSKHPHQLSLTYAESWFMKICHTTNYRIFQYFNIFCNCMIVIGIMLITNELSKKRKMNKSLSFILTLSFSALPLLCVFIYGDIPGFTFAIYSFYFLMKYGNTDKKRYLLIASLFMMIAYFIRKNSAILIIAGTIYLVLNYIEKIEKNKSKKIILKNIINMIFIVMFAVISFFPTNIFQNIMVKKLNLQKNVEFPTSAWIYMAMSESERAPGWYRETTALWAWNNKTDVADKMYKDAIAERLKYFSQNKSEIFKFYIRKNATMWAENTYASFYYNGSFNVGKRIYRDTSKDEKLYEAEPTVYIIEKIVTTIIFFGALINVCERRKNLTNEESLLVIAFLGGFFFHNLWEAKSRYIIPYIIMLIPIASIKTDEINDLLLKILNKNNSETKLLTNNNGGKSNE